MKPSRLRWIAAPATLLLSACTHPTKYSWGDYDKALYSYYQSDGNAADYQKALESAMQGAESTQKLVAPGLYAEYGYLLMQQKQNAQAVTYFEKEKQAWPESARFMEAMMKTASNAATPVASSTTSDMVSTATPTGAAP
ncbi:DUF4810 domain-containing protein [Bordetella sp. LUAb4]|uniref:DUF4810 domain-containing protein n=1 Tax=Bordetella sp. LUAb4 TaxID=2843195 RepID=UPI001E29A500|nr:DUF4810 domain-containing protein [Bordetella sp. LUAb4]